MQTQPMNVTFHPLDAVIDYHAAPGGSPPPTNPDQPTKPAPDRAPSQAPVGPTPPAPAPHPKKKH